MSLGPRNNLQARHIQVLDNEKCLLVVEDAGQNVYIYLQSFLNLSGAMEKRFHKRLHRDKLGDDFILAFDEQKRMLVVCAVTKVGVIWSLGRG